MERKIPIKKHIDPFDSDSDYDDMPMKMIRKNHQDSESIDRDFDFSFHRFSRKSKQDMINKLEAVGALELLGLNKRNGDTDPSESDTEDDDSDYNYEHDDCNTNHHIDDDDELDEYFLSTDDFRTYGEPQLDYFPIIESLTGTSVLKFQPLGAIL